MTHRGLLQLSIELDAMLRREEVVAGEAKAETSKAKGRRRRRRGGGRGRGERPRAPEDDDDGETASNHPKNHYEAAEKAHDDGEGNNSGL